MAAFLTSPELDHFFSFALEEPATIADHVRHWITERKVSVFQYADGQGSPPNLYVVNWAAIRYLAVEASAPDEDALAANGQKKANAFLDESGGLSLYTG